MWSPTRTTQMVRQLLSVPLRRRDATSSSSACSTLSSSSSVQVVVVVMGGTPCVVPGGRSLLRGGPQQQAGGRGDQDENRGGQEAGTQPVEEGRVLGDQGTEDRHREGAAQLARGVQDTAGGARTFGRDAVEQQRRHRGHGEG